MAAELVTPARIAAGRDYATALERLGLEIAGAMWTIPITGAGGPEIELTIVSPIVDRVGATRIHQALFAAYDKARVRRDVDPWIVSIYSPASFLGTAVAGAPVLESNEIFGVMADGSRQSLGEPWIQIADRMYQPSWVIAAPRRMRSDEAQLRRFRGFEKAMAA